MKLNINFGNIIQKNKEIKPWKWAKAKDGKTMLNLPSIFRLAPNKYAPGKGKMLKNIPHCYESSLFQFGCKSCMWKITCKPEVRENV